MRTTVRLVILVLGGILAMAGQNAANEVCAGCHEQAKKLAGTAHGSLGCSQCHLQHEDYPHPANIAKPSCAGCHTQAGQDYAQSVHGQQAAKGNGAAPECSTCHQSAHEVLNPQSADFRKNVPDTCGMCHDKVSAEYKGSIHGQAIARGEIGAAVCTDCHGQHKILARTNQDSPVFGSHVRETCGQCHGNVALARRFGIPADRLTTFDASFHGLAAKSGSQTVANCASCHGIHNIMPSADAKSMTNGKNLPHTCGKCHPGAGTRFALGPVHQAEGKNEPAGLNYVRGFYLFAIPFTIGFMLLHQSGDLIRKLLRHYRGAPVRHMPADKGELRMYPFERLSHALLATSFIILAFTGLALKYPDQWWARPFLLWESNLQLRRIVHRIAAVVMVVVSVMHFAALLVSRNLRHHWYEMLPKFRDATDAAKGMGYNLGLLKEKPVMPSHSYIEKAEYWAVIWGTVIMVITGGLLWFNNWSLQWLPKSILDIATAVHWYEAVLASLAILVWHFYSVIFDPEIYPMDFAWLTGHSSRKRQKHHEKALTAKADETVSAR
jgi:cytochrome b subunit of formate dehydrogenase